MTTRLQQINASSISGYAAVLAAAACYLYAVGIGRLQAGLVGILLMSEIAFAVFYAYFMSRLVPLI